MTDQPLPFPGTWQALNSHSRRVVATMCLLLLAANAAASNSDLNERATSILQSQCVRCHNSKELLGGLSLASRENMLRGGDSGPAVIVGEPAKSRLLKRAAEGSMPPISDGDALPAKDVELLRQWIEAGAEWPAVESQRPHNGAATSSNPSGYSFAAQSAGRCCKRIFLRRRGRRG